MGEAPTTTMLVSVVTYTCLLIGISAATVPLTTFDGADKSLTHEWREKNDPVMGGASNGTFTVKNGVAIMDGNVNLIPRLQAPGFIKFETNDDKAFPDATGCKALSFVARSATNFSGYRISIGTTHAPGGKFFASGFKAPFTAPMDQLVRSRFLLQTSQTSGTMLLARS